MRGKVADASVLAAIVFREPEAEAAEELLGRTSIFVPGILDYELTSVALKKSRRHRAHQGEIAFALSMSRWLRLSYVHTPRTEIYDLALRTDLSVYDASYLWIALALSCPLATLDHQLARTARSSGVKALVVR